LYRGWDAQTRGHPHGLYPLLGSQSEARFTVKTGAKKIVAKDRSADERARFLGTAAKQAVEPN